MKISALIGNNGEQIIASSRGTKLNAHKLKAKAKDTCTIKKKSWIKWFHKCGHFASVFIS